MYIYIYDTYHMHAHNSVRYTNHGCPNGNNPKKILSYSTKPKKTPVLKKIQVFAQACACVFQCACVCVYGVATTSRLLKIIGLFCKRAL